MSHSHPIDFSSISFKDYWQLLPFIASLEYSFILTNCNEVAYNNIMSSAPVCTNDILKDIMLTIVDKWYHSLIPSVNTEH